MRIGLAVLGLLALTAGLVGCTAHQAAQVDVDPPPLVTEAAPPPAPEPEPHPDLPLLQWELSRNVEAYLEGLELVAGGEEILGETRMGTAAEGLMAGMGRCMEIPGCDVAPYLDAFELLLSRQGYELKSQSARVLELEEAIAALETEQEPDTSPLVEVMPDLGQTASLMRGNDLREMVTLNGPVKAAIDDWLTWMRPMLMDAWANYQYLRDDIAPIYEEAGLPEALLFAMIATESGGKVHAHSRAGAAGLLQFMRRTGRVYGLYESDGFDMRYDPAAATRANVAYLNDRFVALNNDLEKALAAYNGGETRVEGLHRRLGGASLWDGRFYYALPRETRDYVPRILAAAWLFLHPEQYHLDWPRVDASKTRLALRREASLGELTVCLGQEGNPDGWFRTLRNLNPKLKPGNPVEVGTEIVVPSLLVPIYEDRCTGGEVVDRARELREANYPEQPPYIPYVVRRGDTLNKIASKFRCASMRELAVINGIRAPRYVIRVGQRIKVPSCG